MTTKNKVTLKATVNREDYRGVRRRFRFKPLSLYETRRTQDGREYSSQETTTRELRL